MKKIILLLSIAVASVFGLSNCSNISSENSSVSYEETKMSLEDQEKGNPVKFLDVTGTYRKNLIGEWVLEGKISSRATVANFKDVELRISYESKTGTDLGYQSKTIYEVIPAGGSKQFKIKIYGPEGSEKVALDIASALPY